MNKLYKWTCPIDEPDPILRQLSGQLVTIVTRYLTGGVLVRFQCDGGMTDAFLSELEPI